MVNIHWEYRGSYRFFSRNCASETLRLVTSVYDDVGFHVENSVRPYGVLNRLIRLGIVDEKYGENNFANLDGLNIMKSYEQHLKTAYSNIFPRAKKIKRKDIFQYTTQGARARYFILEQLEQEGAEDIKRKVASFLLLERLARRTLFSNIQQAMLKILAPLAKEKALPEEINEMMGSTPHSTFLVSDVGYGIPQGREWEMLETAQLSSQSNNDVDSITEQLKTVVEARGTEDQKERLEALVGLLKEELRKIENNIESAQDIMR